MSEYTRGQEREEKRRIGQYAAQAIRKDDWERGQRKKQSR